MNRFSCLASPLMHHFGIQTPARIFVLPLLLVLAILFRLPALINAYAVHSDAAIVGLQAMHILQGEWSWFLWGTQYESSFEAALAAAGFAFTGPQPLTLMLVPLLGYLVLCSLTFVMLQRYLGSWLAFIIALVLVFTPQAVNEVSVFSPRQWSITVVFFSLWCFDRASESKRELLCYACAVLCAIISLYLNLFTIVMLPGVFLFGILCCFDGNPGRKGLVKRIAVVVGSAMAGGVVIFIALNAGALFSHVAVSPDRLSDNLEMLWNESLPWALSYGVFIPGNSLYPVFWNPPVLFKAVQYVGAALFSCALLSGGILFLMRRLPWHVRRMGMLGAAVAVLSPLSFYLSRVPADIWSVRYLAPIIWFAPFALAPLAALVKQKWLAVLLAPYLMAAATGGWLGFGPSVHGPVPVLSPRATAVEEMVLRKELAKRGIRHAAAQYWLSYRLTFLWKEEIVVVPLDPWSDRYLPYRREFDAARDFALIFHPSEPRAKPDIFVKRFQRLGVPFEQIKAGKFIALIVRATR